MKFDCNNGNYIVTLEEESVSIKDLAGEKFPEEVVFQKHTIREDSDLKEDIITLLTFDIDARLLESQFIQLLEEGKSLAEILEVPEYIKNEEISLHFLLELLEGLDITYCLIGGKSLQYNNYYQRTGDVDVFIKEESSFQEIQEVMKKKGAIIHHIHKRNPGDSSETVGSVVSCTYKGVVIDCIFPFFETQLQAIENATPITLSNGKELLVIQAEDLIINKLQAYSYKDQNEISHLIENNRYILDMDYIYKHIGDNKELLRRFETFIS